MCYLWIKWSCPLVLNAIENCMKYSVPISKMTNIRKNQGRYAPEEKDVHMEQQPQTQQEKPGKFDKTSLQKACMSICSNKKNHPSIHSLCLLTPQPNQIATPVLLKLCIVDMTFGKTLAKGTLIAMHYSDMWLMIKKVFLKLSVESDHWTLLEQKSCPLAVNAIENCSVPFTKMTIDRKSGISETFCRIRAPNPSSLHCWYDIWQNTGERYIDCDAL